MKTFHLAHLAISNRSRNREVILKGDSIPSIWSLDSIGNEKLRQKLSNPILGLLFLLSDKIPKKTKKPCGKFCMEFPPTSLFSKRCSSSFNLNKVTTALHVWLASARSKGDISNDDPKFTVHWALAKEQIQNLRQTRTWHVFGRVSVSKIFPTCFSLEI